MIVLLFVLSSFFVVGSSSGCLNECKCTFEKNVRVAKCMILPGQIPMSTTVDKLELQTCPTTDFQLPNHLDLQLVQT